MRRLLSKADKRQNMFFEKNAVFCSTSCTHCRLEKFSQCVVVPLASVWPQLQEFLSKRKWYFRLWISSMSVFDTKEWICLGLILSLGLMYSFDTKFRAYVRVWYQGQSIDNSHPKTQSLFSVFLFFFFYFYSIFLRSFIMKVEVGNKIPHSN